MKIRLVVAAGAFLAALSVPTAAVASAPAVTVTPPSLTFGAQNPEGPYSSQAFTVANSGDAPLVISSVTVENSAPGGGNDYTQTNNCYPFPRALAPGESCAITIGFFPNAYGVSDRRRRHHGQRRRQPAPGAADRLFLPVQGDVHP